MEQFDLVILRCVSELSGACNIEQIAERYSTMSRSGGVSLNTIHAALYRLLINGYLWRRNPGEATSLPHRYHLTTRGTLLLSAKSCNAYRPGSPMSQFRPFSDSDYRDNRVDMKSVLQRGAQRADAYTRLSAQPSTDGVGRVAFSTR